MSPFFHIIFVMTFLGLPSMTVQVSVTVLPSVGVTDPFWETLVLGGSVAESSYYLSTFILIS